jgi:rare lipoprotein A (peptidoglycan hydrolase)
MIASILSLMFIGCQSVTAYKPFQHTDDYKFETFVPVPEREESNIFVEPKVIVTAPPSPSPLPSVDPTPRPVVKSKKWILDPEVSWYGPGFYGKRTACGHAYTTEIMGVAHRSLPCGTLVTFMWQGKYATVPVIDRGPYVAGRTWDLSGGLCVYLDHCFTGSIYYRMGK